MNFLTDRPAEKNRKKEKRKDKTSIPHLLLSICVLVHGAQGVLNPRQPSRQAQQQAHHPLQVSDEQVVPLQLYGLTALTDQHLQRLPVSHVLLNLCLERTAHFFQRVQSRLDIRHQQTLLIQAEKVKCEMTLQNRDTR